MKELIKKLIEKLEELEQARLEMHDWQGQSAICDVIAIINELAEEYSANTPQKSADDWIPCSEGMPDKYEVVLVYCKGRFTEGTRVGEECKTHGIAYCYHGRTWHVFQPKAIKDIEVIAWMPLPAPYQPKGENNGTDS